MLGRDLAVFVARRIVLGCLVLVLASSVVFLFVHIAPGSPEQSLVRGSIATPELIESARERFHLDDPLPAQYWSYLGNIVSFDFGESYRTRENVLTAIYDRVWVTTPLIAFAVAIAMLVGIPLGAFIAYRQGSFLDRAVSGSSIVGASAPPFAMAIILLYVFAITLGWFPATGTGSGFLDTIWHLTLPAVVLSLSGLAPMIKLTRTAVTETLRSDHVVFARARGLPPRQIFLRHVLRNAGVGILTASGIVIVAMFVYVPLVEIPFGIDGLGAYLVDSVVEQDLPVVQALTILSTALILAVNLVVDLLYFALDPRLRIRSEAR
jgi:peptide/nickel transport system permease protein